MLVGDGIARLHGRARHHELAGPDRFAGATIGPQAVLAEGRHFGYVKGADASSHTLVFDLAEFLSGEEAEQAAQQDGQEVQRRSSDHW